MGTKATIYIIITAHRWQQTEIQFLLPEGVFYFLLNLKIDFIKLKQPSLKILVFSSQDKDLYILRYLSKKTDGFLNKLPSKGIIENA